MAEVVDNPEQTQAQISRDQWQSKVDAFTEAVSMAVTILGITLVTVGLSFWLAWFVGVTFLGAAFIGLGILLGYSSSDSDT